MFPEGFVLIPRSSTLLQLLDCCECPPPAAAEAALFSSLNQVLKPLAGMESTGTSTLPMSFRSEEEEDDEEEVFGTLRICLRPRWSLTSGRRRRRSRSFSSIISKKNII